jgi:hypothetical protein
MGGSTARFSMHQRRRARQPIEYRCRAGPSKQPGDTQVPNRGHTTPLTASCILSDTTCTVQYFTLPFFSVQVTVKTALHIQYTVLGLNDERIRVRFPIATYYGLDGPGIESRWGG